MGGVSLGGGWVVIHKLYFIFQSTAPILLATRTAW